MTDVGAMKCDIVLNTDGDGYWSDVATAVRVTELEAIVYRAAESDWCDCDYGHLRVHFDVASWNVKENGLIYTDDQFEAELRAYLVSLGLSEKAAKDVGYSEQGMQGNSYVDFDIGQEFVKEWDTFTLAGVKVPA